MSFEERWPLLARNVPEALDELEAHWRHALESGAHVEGDWRDLGLTGNERHRFDHAKAWAERGNREDLKGQTGRGLMVSQLMIEQNASEDRSGGDSDSRTRGRVFAFTLQPPLANR